MRNIKMNDYKREWDNRNRCWIYEHRKVMTKKIGRDLLSHEQVHHIDENILNNNPKNLELLSEAKHCQKHSPSFYRRKLTDFDVEHIRRLWTEGMKLKRLSMSFDVSESTISKICSGKRR